MGIMTKRRAAIGSLAIAAGVIASLASAHEGATGVVKERMDAMTEMGKQLKEISHRVATNRNLASIAEIAMRIDATAAKIPALFPAGSSVGVTDAMPAIWQRWDEFTTKADALGKAAAALAAASASGDTKLISARAVALGDACVACHDLFREKKR
jgi:cytochrome c556